MSLCARYERRRSSIHAGATARASGQQHALPRFSAGGTARLPLLTFSAARATRASTVTVGILGHSCAEWQRQSERKASDRTKREQMRVEGNTNGMVVVFYSPSVAPKEEEKHQLRY